MCGLDTETAPPEYNPDGPNVNEERVLSCALALVGGGGETWAHEYRFNPGFSIPPESSAIHGIHDEDLADCPPFEAEAEAILDVLMAAAEEGQALVAYNAAYDLTVLDREFKRVGIDPSALWKVLLVVDPMVIDRMLDTYRRGKKKLENVTAIWNARAKRQQEAAGIEWKADRLLERAHGAVHTATDDAVGVCRLAWLLAAFGVVYSYERPIWQNERPDRDLVQRQQEWTAYKDDLPKLYQWVKAWRAADQLRLQAHWAASDNPDIRRKAEGVRPEWPVYPEGVKIG
jgi:DNA polymerase-3 subunit epsilon